MQTIVKFDHFQRNLDITSGPNETAVLHTQGGATVHVELVSGEQKGEQVQACRYPTVIGVLQLE
jgi:hypothetical protein